MAQPLRREVLGSYRYVLRAISDTFRGDARAVKTSLTAARAEFRKHGAVTDAAVVKKMVHDARDAADFLRHSIVQAQLNSEGRYEMKLHSPDNKSASHIDLEPASAGAPPPGTGECCGGGPHSRGPVSQDHS